MDRDGLTDWLTGWPASHAFTRMEALLAARPGIALCPKGVIVQLSSSSDFVSLEVAFVCEKQASENRKILYLGFFEKSSFEIFCSMSTQFKK